MLHFPKITILSGHFGSGKTEIAINLALTERKTYEKVAINDLDIINPYFRSRDVAGMFQEKDIELLAPANRLAASDLPIVSGEIYRVLHDPRYHLIVDAGGDKDGAMALGQYYHDWKDFQPELIFVLNANRPYVSTLDGAIYTVEQIEKASRLKVTGIVNNSNVGRDTSLNDIQNGYKLSCQLAEYLKIPMLYTTLSTHLMKEAAEFVESHTVMFIERYMKVPWEA